jgi:hypothetical protein
MGRDSCVAVALDSGREGDRERQKPAFSQFIECASFGKSTVAPAGAQEGVVASQTGRMASTHPAANRSPYYWPGRDAPSGGLADHGNWASGALVCRLWPFISLANPDCVRNEHGCGLASMQ